MDPRHADIAPPPSLDDILSATPDIRLGQVDFSRRLARDIIAGPVSTPLEDPHAEPPVEVDPVLDADAQATAETAEAAEEATVVEPTPDIETEADEHPSPVAPLRSAERSAEHSADHRATTPRSVSAAPSATGGVEVDYVGLSVDDVAASVIARMREAGEASRRHLESIEGEAARRCELLTAQAELDAELIRLHARREAHAIITAARMRAGTGTGPGNDSERLNQIGESFSRFAESIETAVAESPQAPDHPLRP